MENLKLKVIERILKLRKNRSVKLGSVSNIIRENHQNTEVFKANKEKGIAFEKFVVQRFDDEYFNLIEWRSDKEVNGISALMNKLPDLEFYYESNNDCLQFAVECKWKEYFYDHSFQLKEEHLEFIEIIIA